VSQSISASLAPAAATPWLRRAVIVIAASAFVAVCSHVALPLYFTPVPLTLGPFAVLVLGLVLSPRMAASALVAYLAEGAAGLPVFAPGPMGAAGLAHLLGPTAGYLVAYPFAAALISVLWRGSSRRPWAALPCAAAGNLLILACGAVWLAVFTHASAQTVFAIGVMPFLAADALKVGAAAALAVGLQRLSRRAR
jgi:biotin transport system substrate-specific component